MQFSMIDLAVFVIFVISVVSLGMFMSRKEKTGEDYFLAGRGLKWWLIGFSLIAANISTEQFVGMSGNAASHVGLAIASYEWMAAVTLVVVAFGFLPYFLRAGIFTMPEFLEYRYNWVARIIMAVATLFIYLLLLGAVTYSGALTISSLAAQMGYTVPLFTGSLVIGLIAMIYVGAGGLKACAWADLIQGSALIIGGGIIMYFAFQTLGNANEAYEVTDVATGAVQVTQLDPQTGPVERFWDLNKVRMNMVLPATDPILPWTALLLGLWIPNFYYWGLNQYITQRTLGSASLAEGQKGIVFSAFMKLLIPFVIVIPGIIAFNLYAKDMQKESVKDNAPVIAKYYKANPGTDLVEVVKDPSEEAIKNWPQGRFMIALFDSPEAIESLKEHNPFVLPMLESDYQATTVGDYTIFDSEDHAWRSVYPQLSAELDLYNQTVVDKAMAANKLTTKEKFIAYKYDTALAQLLGNVLPQGVGLVGFVLAALLGAVVSSLAAMLNAASTIFTMDIFKKHVNPDASQNALVLLGRICVVIFACVAIFLAPQLGNPKISNSIFTIIQESQGFLSPGILAVFVFGLVIRRAPAICGAIGLITNFVVYGGLKYVSTIERLMQNDTMSFLIGNFLNRMAISFVVCLLVMTFIRIVKPLGQPVEFRHNTTIELHSSKRAIVAGIIVVLATLLLYFLFSPLGLIKD